VGPVNEITARQALRQLARGTTAILRGLVWAGEWRETLARWTIAAVAASLALSGAALHPWLWPILAALWIAAASAAAGPLADEPADEADDEDEDGQDDDPDDEPEPDGLIDADAFTELVRDVADGRNVHLATIRAQLALETGREWSAAAVTALCDTAGIPVRKGVRVPGAQPAVTTGIHHTDLPAPHSPASAHPPVGVVPAGQHSNNNTNTPTVEKVGEGAAIIKRGPSIRQEARR
jgi:hypothetical protein